MAKFRKKPVVIEAIQHTGTEENRDEIYFWSNELIVCGNLEDGGDDYSELFIDTLEGMMKSKVGDWIIKGVNGEFYPCKPDIFEKTYEPA